MDSAKTFEAVGLGFESQRSHLCGCPYHARAGKLYAFTAMPRIHRAKTRARTSHSILLQLVLDAVDKGKPACLNYIL
jgi:hypothetical protein